MSEYASILGEDASPDKDPESTRRRLIAAAERVDDVDPGKRYFGLAERVEESNREAAERKRLQDEYLAVQQEKINATV